MDYAIQLLLPILGGLLLGFWLTEQYGVPPIWTVVLAILGMMGGIGILYKRFSYPHLYPQAKKTPPKDSGSDSEKPPSSKRVTPGELDFLYRDAEDDDGQENSHGA